MDMGWFVREETSPFGFTSREVSNWKMYNYFFRKKTKTLVKYVFARFEFKDEADTTVIRLYLKEADHWKIVVTHICYENGPSSKKTLRLKKYCDGEVVVDVTVKGWLPRPWFSDYEIFTYIKEWNFDEYYNLFYNEAVEMVEHEINR